jgi:hypothetical protein
LEALPGRQIARHYQIFKENNVQNKNHWYRNFRFKLFVVLCAIALLGQGLFIQPQPALAREVAAGHERPAALSAGDADSYMSTVSWGPGRLDIFTIGRSDGSIWIRSYENQWYPWASLGNPGFSFYSVSAVAWGPNRLDVFGVTGSANSNVYTVWHKAWDGSGWWPWENIGSGAGNLASGVQAVSWGSGHLEIFTRSTTNSLGSGPLLHKWWLGSWGPSQTGWETLDSSTAPATFFAVSHSPNRMDLFRTLVSNKAISRRSFNGSGWSGWYGMNNWLSINTPYAVSWGANRIDLFVRGTDGAIGTINTSNGGSSWSGWSSLGAGNMQGPLASPWPASPSAVSWGSGRLDIFEVEQYTRVFHKWYQNGWGGWDDLGGNFSVPGPGSIQYPPQAISWGFSRIDLFQLNGDGRVFHKWTNGNGWGPSQTDWEDLGKP